MSGDGAHGDAQPINALTASQQVLDCFWNLAVPEEDKRLKAAEALIKELLERQSEHAGALGPEAESALAAMPSDLGELSKPKRQEVALRRCCPLMVYALRRLVRGLGSGRQGARQGFATALSLLLSKQADQHSHHGGPFVDAGDVLILIDSCLEAGSSMKAGEARDILIGKLFGLGALARSGLLRIPTSANPSLTSTKGKQEQSQAQAKTPKPGKAAKEAATAATSASADPAAIDAAVSHCCQCVKELLALGSRKSFLREAASGAVLELLRALGPTGASRVLAECDELRAFVSVAHREATPEALNVALCLWPLFSQDQAKTAPLPKDCPVPPLPPGEVARLGTLPAPCQSALFSTSYLRSILPPLLECSTSNPRLHSLWTHLLPQLLPSMLTGPGAASATSVMHLESFWSVVVEGGLLASPSHERKFLALRLFQAILPHLGPDHVPVVFTRNFAHILSSNLIKKDNYLHAAARKCMDMINSFVEGSTAEGGNGGARLAVAAALRRLGSFGLSSAQVQALTNGTMRKKGKEAAATMAAAAAASKLSTVLDGKGICSYISSMIRSFLQAGQARSADDEADEAQAQAQSEAESQRSHAVEQLSAVVRFPATTQRDVERVLRFLATHAFLTATIGASAGKAPGAAAAAAAEEDKKKRKKEKKKGNKQEAEALSKPEPDEEVEGDLRSCAAVQVPVSELTRRLCARRLFALMSILAPHKQQRMEAASQQTSRQPSGQQKKEVAEKADPAAPLPTAVAAPLPTAVAAAIVDGPAVATALLDLLHRGIDGGSLGGLRVALATPFSSEQDVTLTMLKEIETALASHLKPGGGREAPNVAASKSMLHLIRILQVAVLADPEGVEPDLAAGLRRVSREGIGAPLEDLEVQEPGADDEGGEEEGPEEGQEGAAPWQDVLVDVSLSLLSKPASKLPSAPLREAVEAIWRLTAEQALTPAGMTDLVRVVVAGAGRDSGAEDVLGARDEQEDEDEVELDEAGTSSGDGDGDSSEDDNDNDDEMAASANEGTGKEDDDDDDGGGADDAEMFRMDAKMAAYLRGMIDARQGAKERRAALCNLRLRALALIETFAKKVPGSPLLMLALPPLARALPLTRRGQGSQQGSGSDLANRMQSVLQGLSKSLASPGRPAIAELPMSLEELSSGLRRTLGVASREKDRVAAQAAALAWSALVKASASAKDPSGAHETASESFRAGLLDVLHKKKSRLHRSTLEELSRAVPSVAIPVLPEVLKSCMVAARSGHTQHEALLLLAALLRLPNKPTASNSKKPSVAPSLSSVSTAAAIADVTSVPSSATPDPVLETLRSTLLSLGPSVGAAIVSAASGGEDCAVARRPAAHAEALKAAVLVVERLKALFGKSKRLSELLGHNSIHGLAKAVVTVKEVGASGKVQTQVDRLVSAVAIADLVAKSGPDPSLKARLVKAREAVAAQETSSNAMKNGEKKKGDKKKGDKKKTSTPGQRTGGKAGAATAGEGASRGTKLTAEAAGGPPLKKQKVDMKQPRGNAMIAPAAQGKKGPERTIEVDRVKDHAKKAKIPGSVTEKKPSAVAQDTAAAKDTGCVAGVPKPPSASGGSDRDPKHRLAGKEQVSSKTKRVKTS